MLHSDRLRFESKQKASEVADEIGEGVEEEIGECLVVFHALEEEDENDIESVISQAKGEIRDVADKVEVEKIVIYPYVHLVSEPASVEKAQEVSERLYKYSMVLYSISLLKFNAEVVFLEVSFQ